MLALILAGAIGASPAAVPAPGTYTYVSSMNGQPIGNTRITISQAAGSVLIAEQGTANFDGAQGSVTDTLRLGAAQLTPATYQAQASLQGQPFSIDVTFNGSTAVQTGYTQKTYDLVPGTTHFVLLDMGAFSGWFALPAQMQAWNDASVVAVVPGMGSGIPFTPDAAQPSARPPGVPATDRAISVTTPVAFSVWYNPKTLVTDYVDLPAQGVTVSRSTTH